MTTLTEVMALLQRVSLDRATKLRVIDIIAVNADSKIVDDMGALLRSYEEMDIAEREALVRKLSAIDATYKDAVKDSASGLNHDVLTAQDEIKRNDEIERVRQTLMDQAYGS